MADTIATKLKSLSQQLQKIQATKEAIRSKLELGTTISFADYVQYMMVDINDELAAISTNAMNITGETITVDSATVSDINEELTNAATLLAEIEG